MRRLFVGSCAKEPDRPEANEDAFAFSADGQRFALSDGASESYDSRVWARMLVTKLAQDPAFGPEWMRSAIAGYMRKHDVASMSWSQQRAFERGCFASLLCAEHDAAANKLSLFGVGDSVAVLFEGDRVARAWPLDEAARFRERPTLLSTLREHNHFTLTPAFNGSARETVDLAEFEDPTLLCMTDALGEWTLRIAASENPDPVSELLTISREEQLESLVIREREAKRMRVDDSTLAILKFDRGQDCDGLPHP